MSRDDIELNIASARLLLNLIPGLDSAVLSVSLIIDSLLLFFLLMSQCSRMFRFSRILKRTVKFCELFKLVYVKIFQEPEGLIPQLYRWAESDATNYHLRAYSFGLLSAVLDVTSVASSLKIENSTLIPIALRRLKDLFVSYFILMISNFLAQIIDYTIQFFLYVLQERMEREGQETTEVSEPDKENREEDSEDDDSFADVSREPFPNGRVSLADVSGSYF